jgi:hypothetical protein
MKKRFSTLFQYEEDVTYGRLQYFHLSIRQQIGNRRVNHSIAFENRYIRNKNLNVKMFSRFISRVTLQLVFARSTIPVR